MFDITRWVPVVTEVDSALVTVARFDAIESIEWTGKQVFGIKVLITNLLAVFITKKSHNN